MPMDIRTFFTSKSSNSNAIKGKVAPNDVSNDSLSKNNDTVVLDRKVVRKNGRESTLEKDNSTLKNEKHSAVSHENNGRKVLANNTSSPTNEGHDNVSTIRSRHTPDRSKRHLVLTDDDSEDDEDSGGIGVRSGSNRMSGRNYNRKSKHEVLEIEDDNDDGESSDKKLVDIKSDRDIKSLTTPQKKRRAVKEEEISSQEVAGSNDIEVVNNGLKKNPTRVKASLTKDVPVDSPRRTSPRRMPPKRTTVQSSDDEESNTDDDFVTSTAEPTRSSTRGKKLSSASNDEDKSPPEKSVSLKPNQRSVSRPRQSSATKKSPSKSTQSTSEVRLQPTQEADRFDVRTLLPEILKNHTFVFTGLLSGISREEAQEIVKGLGGRVTSAVSSKTDYLVHGDELEDGRPYTEGTKYKRALQTGTTLVHGDRAFFGLLKQYNQLAVEKSGNNISTPSLVKSMASDSESGLPSVGNSNVSSMNPYTAKNPYASRNPYAKKPSHTIDAASLGSKMPKSSATGRDPSLQSKSNNIPSSTNQLWVDKYKPSSSSEILGNQDAVRKLSTWLASWEDRFNNPQAIGKTFSAPNGPWKAALLSGPPGIGKTTTATLVARESGRDVLEFNASDVRSKKALQEELGDITGSLTLEFTFKKPGRGKAAERTKRCIIMDEVDGMGAGDRSGIAELIQMIKNSRVPIICICNDRQNQKMKSLVPYCMDLKYRRPVKSVIVNRAVEVASREGLTVEWNAAEAIVESCGNDVRQVLNCLQMWSSKKDSHGSRNGETMTYRELKEREHSINKDEILRVSLFDATRVIVEGRKGLLGADQQTERNHFFQRTDAFFVDYNFIGLMVQQNYLKVMQPQYNEIHRQNDQDGKLDVICRMSDAATSMSDFACVEKSLREEQNWSLLPLTAVLAVKTGFHAGGDRGGFLPGFPEFTTWLGRNSSKSKKARLLNELAHHMNYKVCGGANELRLSYIPVLRDRFITMLVTCKDPDIESAIDFMDEYGLDRDDIFEKLDEFKMSSSGPDFSKVDSKMKAAFTRAYNQGTHTSQALVAEQGAAKKSKRGSGGGGFESIDFDAIDDDKIETVVDEDDDEEDDELDEEKIKAMFKKKGRATPSKTKSKQQNPSKKTSRKS